jgi:hypothetical protein
MSENTISGISITGNSGTVTVNIQAPVLSNSSVVVQRATRKRKSYSANFKLQFVEAVETLDRNEAVRRFFPDKDPDIPHERESVFKLYRDWKKARPSLKAMLNKRRRKNRAGKARLPQEFEDFLSVWIRSFRDDGLVVTRAMVRMKALSMAKDPEWGIDTPYKASYSWLKRFLKRWSFAVRMKSRIG